MTKARDLADIVSNLSANASKAVVVNAGGTELTFGDAGSSEFYGFKYVDTNSDGIKEDLQITTTNSGADNISVTNVATDIFDESFFASRNLTFTINANGDLVVSV
jgi:hypothetical protein